MIPFNDLRTPYTKLKSEIDDAVQRVLESGWYILGSEVTAFEREFAQYHGLADEAHCVGVNSGTDALQLALLACGVGPGHEVITVSHTAVATVAAIRQTGATPVLVDVTSDTYTLDPAALDAAITDRTRAIIPVHLYGHPADMGSICAIAEQAGSLVIEDCAQAHGATYNGKPVGTLGAAGCFSFYPTKNLGALGDGGAIISRDGALMQRMRELREYGWTPAARYVSQHEGINSRLDEMQSAILRVKLRHLDEWNSTRRRLAAIYYEHLPQSVHPPVELPGCHHVYHLYVTRMAERERMQGALSEAGIATGIHYPAPVHQQPAYSGNVVRTHALTNTEQIQTEILSLPLHPFLTEEQARYIATTIQKLL